MKLLTHSELDTLASTDHGQSVLKILEGTLEAIGDVGARRLSMSDICTVSGVSRGTLYRYFKTKEEVLAAASEYVCSNFERGIVEAGRAISDPIERFRAIMRFYARFTVERSPVRIFEVEPAFHLNFFRSHFARHKAAVRTALNPVLDYFETVWGHSVNRDVFVDSLVRLQLSTLIVPATEEWIDRWNDTPDALQAWVLKLIGRSAEPKERMN